MPVAILKIGPRSTARHRLKIVLGKSVARQAVQRNLIKRRVRAVLNPLVRRWPNELVVLVRPEAAKKTYAALAKELTAGLGTLRRQQ